jgi:hypothetical protein
MIKRKRVAKKAKKVSKSRDEWSDFIAFLKHKWACAPAMEWLGGYSSLKKAWKECHNGSWLSWLLNATEHPKAQEAGEAMDTCTAFHRTVRVVRVGSKDDYICGGCKEQADVIRKIVPNPPNIPRLKKARA